MQNDTGGKSLALGPEPSSSSLGSAGDIDRSLEPHRDLSHTSKFPRTRERKGGIRGFLPHYLEQQFSDFGTCGNLPKSWLMQSTLAPFPETPPQDWRAENLHLRVTLEVQGVHFARGQLHVLDRTVTPRAPTPQTLIESV